MCGVNGGYLLCGGRKRRFFTVHSVGFVLFESLTMIICNLGYKKRFLNET